MSEPPADATPRPTRRDRFEARLMRRSGDLEPAAVIAWKRRVLGDLASPVVEIGPGAGANMPYYPAGTAVIGIEPNVAMHEPLRRAAADAGVDLEVRTRSAEAIDLGDDAVPSVVGTLVLCGVGDPDAAVAEVRRILAPGGQYVFYEHVRAPEGTATRWGQRLLRGVHTYVFNGCQVDRDLGAVVHRVFDDVTCDPIDTGWQNVHTRTRIHGIARG
ncbi:class I SAM-dependent methyltransferase [Euzebya sp.]|uniref:class I SAM-dependent methyltransferase n=1 Tax=Euzebya sp. TaxID=1971409 RepID=UPI003513396C